MAVIEAELLLLAGSLTGAFAVKGVVGKVEFAFGFFLFLQLHFKVFKDLLVELIGIAQTVLPLDVFDKDVVSVFDGVFGADSFELSGDEGPSASVIFNHDEKLYILLKGPVSFLDVGVEMADPFLPAHGEGFKVATFRSAVELIGDRFPLRFVLFIAESTNKYLMIYLKSSIYSFSHSLLFFCLVWMMSLI